MLRRKRLLRVDDNSLVHLLRRQKKKKKIINSLILLVAYLTDTLTAERTMRTTRRHGRHHSWWNLVWTTYDEHRFKDNFRVTRATFMYILQHIRPGIEKQRQVEEPISPECRLGI